MKKDTIHGIIIGVICSGLLIGLVLLAVYFGTVFPAGQEACKSLGYEKMTDFDNRFNPVFLECDEKVIHAPFVWRNLCVSFDKWNNCEAKKHFLVSCQSWGERSVALGKCDIRQGLKLVDVSEGIENG